MLIKKYITFIRESFDTNGSIGTWIETKSEDPEIMRIINRYLNDSSKIYGGDDISPTIKLSNAIDLLSPDTQKEIKHQIDQYLQHGVLQKDPEILASTEIGPDFAKKGVFQSFLKAHTALGLKDHSPNWNETPADMLFYWQSPDLDFELVSGIFSRFRSLEIFFPKQITESGTIRLYFGVKCDSTLEYGSISDKKNVIGKFKLNKSSRDWILKLESKSSGSLKEHLKNLDFSDIRTLGQIKLDLESWSPGSVQKRAPVTISDRIISFGFYGVGKWDNGQLFDGELEKMKTDFVNWLVTKKWSQKVLISVKANQFWTYIHLKLK